MGNFEKLVVLTVLFLAVIILGVSVHQASETELLDDPLANNVEEVAAKPQEKPVKETTSPENAMLSSLTDRGNRAEPKNEVVERPDFSKPTDAPQNNTAKKPESKPSQPAAKRGLLLTTESLVEPMFGNDYMVYTWKSGDNAVALAEKYYGDRNMRDLILLSNEGSQFRPGDQINMPIRDLRTAAGQRPAKDPVPAHPVTERPETAGKVVMYTVKDGDSLWGIAKEAYGKGTEWEKIYKANLDVMKSENDIKAGMQLRLP